MITKQAFIDAATSIDVEIAAIKAVAEVESTGEGFTVTGLPKILFEPHVFWDELEKRGINPRDITGHGDILYEKWGSKPYGKYSEQHGRLKRAMEINEPAALSSASWGKFQIMGYNFTLAGFATLEAFIAAMHIDEDQHLRAFINFVKNKKLDRYLREKNWEKFAEGYNGKGYKKNNYHIKLPAAYLRFKSS